MRSMTATTIAILLTSHMVAAYGPFASVTQGLTTPDQRTSGTTDEAPTRTAQSVDLNTADHEALETLPGIGPKTAALILEYRRDSGEFSKVEDLMNVRGIGERTFLRLRELVHVEPSASQP